MTEPRNYTHIWKWSKYPCARWNEPGEYKDLLCRVQIKSKGPGPKNCLVEFENGHKVVVTNAAVRFAMRRID